MRYLVDKLLLVAVAIDFVTSMGYKCSEQMDPSKFRCICTIPNLGISIDITKLGSITGEGAMSFDNVPTWGQITYDPCYTFQCLEQIPNTAAVCQFEDGQPIRELSSQSQADGTYYDNGTYTIVYKKNAHVTNPEVTVQFFCDPGEPRDPTIIGATSDFIFIKWPTRLMCTGPSPTPKPPSSLSIGSIILLVTLVVVIIYLVTGVLYNYKIGGLQGARLIPNSFFWVSFGQNIVEGCKFLTNKIFRRNHYANI
ncbi:hypothetical protein Ciccas_012562 [Cichlidogyrus casuarinus]|uniref:Cation-dependent mannose-6-phosphate receptor n=1 Tax=Cichlidogyrus casuarinus TaxID=1844966 RepID=A0ABD2PT23_9PLAT